MSERVYLIGASGHAKVVADILNEEGRFIIGVFDQNTAIQGLWNMKVMPQPRENWPKEGAYLIAVGDNGMRKRIAKEFVDHLVFTRAIHPKTVISPYAQIGEGTVAMAGAVVNPDACVGKHVILNTNCSIDHECRIADYVHISPNVALAGNVQVGEGTHIGIGACVIQGIKIGKWCTIGAGAVVIEDVPDGVTVVGNPGKVLPKMNTSLA